MGSVSKIRVLRQAIALRKAMQIIGRLEDDVSELAREFHAQGERIRGLEARLPEELEKRIEQLEQTQEERGGPRRWAG